MSTGNGGSFPEGFVWGAATASYQIEGAVREDGRGESIWDRFSHTPGKVANSDTGDVACDHYHRYATDVRLMQDLNLGAYRFSIAWPRILPNGTGKPNGPGLDFYDRLVDALLEANITPFATLYHWDLPQALEDRGGWLNRDTAAALGEYTDVITRRLGDRVSNWITINEPWVAAFLGYGVGIHAPGHRDMTEALLAGHTLLRAHGEAMPVIRANVRNATAGITLNMAQHEPLDADSEADHEAARLADLTGNRWFIDPIFGRGYPEELAATLGATAPEIQPGDMEAIAAPTDFLGINFYMPVYSSASRRAEPMAMPTPDPSIERTAMGWPVVPASFTELLTRVTRDYAPPAIYITENGAAFNGDRVVNGRVADPRRTAYYEGHISAVGDAISAGAPVRGYFAWSLLDNFEWAEGYSKRFGITYVDYATQARTVKDSGRWYAQVAGTNRLS